MFDGQFQSQTRSRSTCDVCSIRRSWLRGQVSISDEKPLHMRRTLHGPHAYPLGCFNLRREAAPHATGQFLEFINSLGNVSISDKKPLHMRHVYNSFRL